ncbi:hypothetical protein D3C74_351770 [compost metagenome]
MDASNARNSLFLCGNLNLAKAKAAILDVNVPTTVTLTATMRLFLIPLSNGPASQISLYFSNWNTSGIHTGGSANTSCFSFNDVDNIQISGAIIAIAPIASTIKMIEFVNFLF